MCVEELGGLEFILLGAPCWFGLYPENQKKVCSWCRSNARHTHGLPDTSLFSRPPSHIFPAAAAAK